MVAITSTTRYITANYRTKIILILAITRNTSLQTIARGRGNSACHNIHRRHTCRMITLSCNTLAFWLACVQDNCCDQEKSDL